MNRKLKIKKQNGFSLIELLIVIIVLGAFAAYFLSSIKTDVGDGKKLSSEVARSIRERRASAIRLMQPNEAGFRNYSPVSINFTNLENTARLVIDGKDDNNDGNDDNSNERLTRYNERDNNWNYAYEERGITMPSNWRIVEDIDGLSKFPTIPGAALTTEIKFDQDGRCFEPPPVSEGTGRDEAPFYAVYFIDTGSITKGSTKLAIAVAFHCSGLVEEWTYNSFEKVWKGNGGRN